MPDFSKYSNYNEQTSFSDVVFGANSPVLEVELNELQQIADTKFKRLTDIIGGCIHPMTNGYVKFYPSTKYLELANCVVVANGFFGFLSSLRVHLSATLKYAYVKMQQKTVDGTTDLKAYGSSSAVSIPNPIYDSRVGAETSRRRLIEVTLVAGSSIPANTDTTTYVLIGELVGDEFIPESVLPSLTDFGVTLKSAGEMCIVYDEED